MRKGKIIIAAVLIIAASFATWKLLKYNNASKDTVGERLIEPVLAVFDRNGELKGMDLTKCRHLFIRWNNEEVYDISKQLAPVLTGNQPLLITLEIWPSPGSKILGDKIITQVTEGLFDKKITALCSYLSKQTQQVLIRFEPEMEVYVDVYPWQKQSSGFYIEAFRHVAELVKKNAPAAKMVWAPAGHPGAEEFWPGTEWVDMISVTLKGKSELMSKYYPEPSTLTNVIKRKILRTRFFDKPVLLIGTEKMNAANFQQQRARGGRACLA